MADEADIAQELELFSLKIRLAGRQRNPLPVTGFCYNCDDRVPEKLFCDGDCREDYEKRAHFLHMKIE
ncbi:hypothetical protein OJ723_003143 [Salmonella enterica]|nr:hypothetical protein [Salmonella enterica subsp. enterica serovar Orientalis]EBJ4008374.1 hypothetical protein [Salmonella enterica]EBQ9235406.1 hypothetical protein [Salmonella enterica subsp. enterica serovar Orientalis]EKA1667298.1 hypothetical protein [Salmonella enterica]